MSAGIETLSDENIQEMSSNLSSICERWAKDILPKILEKLKYANSFQIQAKGRLREKTQRIETVKQEAITFTTELQKALDLFMNCYEDGWYGDEWNYAKESLVAQRKTLEDALTPVKAIIEGQEGDELLVKIQELIGVLIKELKCKDSGIGRQISYLVQRNYNTSAQIKAHQEAFSAACQQFKNMQKTSFRFSLQAVE